MSMAWNKRADMTVHEQDPYNAEPPRAALAAGPLTPTDTFYVRNHGPVPETPTDWRLHVGGLVDEPGSWTLAGLRHEFRTHETVATVQCAGNRRAGYLGVRDIPGEDPWGPGATGTAIWTGLRLADLLRRTGLRPGAAHVAFTAADTSDLATPPQPFGGSIPLAKATADEVLLAWAMNGEPLSPVHGAPLRAVVPGWIGARSVKWLERVDVRAEPSDSWFQDVAYRMLPPDARPGPGAGFALGPIALNCDVLQPDDGAELAVGPQPVLGYALAGGDRGVARVDVSVDGGRTWVQADLGMDQGPWAWRLWHALVYLPSGSSTITARAWDTAAAAQPEDPAPLWNPKGYANNSWARIAVSAR